MLKRYSLTPSLDDLTDRFDIGNVLMTRYRPRYNIAPTQTVPAIVAHRNVRMLDDFRWGLIPFWANDSVNADVGALRNKPIHVPLLKRNRCVIPCSGYYVWPDTDKRSQPMHVIADGDSLFGIAGVYDVRISPMGEEMRTCTMLTRQADPVTGTESGVLPLVLDQEGMEAWLNPKLTDPDEAAALAQSPATMDFQAYAVSTIVNDPDADSEACIQPAD